MNASRSTSPGVLVFLVVTAAFAVGSNWYSAAKVREADTKLAAAVHAQAAELSRLIESVDVLTKANAGLSAAVVLRSASVAGTAMSPEQVDRLSAAVATRVTETVEPVEPPESTPENIQAATTARNILATALREKRWTATSAQEFRTVLVQASPEDRVELQRQVALAINNNEMALDLYRH